VKKEPRVLVTDPRSPVMRDRLREQLIERHAVRKGVLSLAALLVVGLLAAGCGSDEPEASSTTDWAAGVCTAINTWADSIKSAADPIKSGDISEDSLESAADDVKSATDTLESDLEDLGEPDTESGQQAKDSLDQLSSDLSTETDTITSAVEDVSGVSDVAAAVTTVGTALATMQTQVTSAYTSLTQLDAKGELQTAIQEASSCQQLTSAS
jgi:hypothetical protein